MVSSQTTDGTIQLHLTHSYKVQINMHPQVRAYLARGYTIENLQRISDREVLVTLGCKADAH